MTYATAIAAAPTDTITVLTTKGPLATKVISPTKVTSYGEARRFSASVRRVSNIFDVSEVMTSLQTETKAFVIRGSVAPGANLADMRRLLHPDAETGDAATIVSTARHWVPLDVDSLPCPNHLDLMDAGVVVEHVVSHLPGEFHGVTCHWAFTSSHGVKPGIRIRLYFWSDRPLSDADLKTWLAGYGVDPSIYCPTQPIYTAAPIFDGVPDPCSTRCGLWRGSRDAISAPIITAPRPAANNRAAPPALGRDVSPYLRAAYDNECAAVRNAGQGSRNNALNAAALKLGTLIASGLPEAPIRAGLTAAALAAGLAMPEITATLNSGLRAGMAHPRDIPERQSQPRQNQGASSRPEYDPETGEIYDRDPRPEPPPVGDANADPTRTQRTADAPTDTLDDLINPVDLHAGDPPPPLAPDVVADLARVRETATRLAGMPAAARDMRLKDEARLLGIGQRVLTREIQAVLSKQAQERKKVESKTHKPKWQDDLITTIEGEPRAILANALLALRGDKVWDGVLAFDDFAKRTVFRKPPPWHKGKWKGDVEVSDRDVFLTTEWIQQQDIPCPSTIVGQAIETIAQGVLFHPVREYLDRLVWDGTTRIDTWMIDNLGAVAGKGDADNGRAGEDKAAYIRAVAAKMLIGSVARIYKPGCKLDTMPVFEGPQGLLKSTALSRLFSPWFTDHLPDLSSKDAMVQLQGIWCCEIAEMSALDRAEVRRIKSFLSSAVDRYRPPYGRKPQNFPRQVVFCGTINPEGGYLRDATGGRRFWPVACTKVNLDALQRDRDQLWAEAVDRYKKGESWWLDKQDIEKTASDAAEERYSGDVRDAIIEAYVAGKTSVSVAEVLDECLGSHEKIKWTQADQNMVSRALISIGWKRKRESSGSREWRYRPPEPSQLTETGTETGTDEVSMKSTPSQLSQSVPVDIKVYKEKREKEKGSAGGDNAKGQSIYKGCPGQTGTTGTTGTDGGWEGSV